MVRRPAVGPQALDGKSLATAAALASSSGHLSSRSHRKVAPWPRPPPGGALSASRGGRRRVGWGPLCRSGALEVLPLVANLRTPEVGASKTGALFSAGRRHRQASGICLMAQMPETPREFRLPHGAAAYTHQVPSGRPSVPVSPTVKHLRRYMSTNPHKARRKRPCHCGSRPRHCTPRLDPRRRCTGRSRKGSSRPCPSW